MSNLPNKNSTDNTTASEIKQKTEQYLEKYHINTLLRWLTTELIIYKPEDPLRFIANRANRIVDSDDGYSYSLETIEGLLEKCRLKTESEIEQEKESYIDVRTDDLSKLVASMQKISSKIDPEEAIKSIVQETCELLHCEQATVFTIENNQLLLHGPKAIKYTTTLEIGQGIAGTVAQTGKAEIINDAYSDSRFDNSFDKLNDFKTSSILCCPLKDDESCDVYGVIQAINKRDNNGCFRQYDVKLLESLGTQVVISLKNAIMFDFASQQQRKNDALLKLFKALNSDENFDNLNSLCFELTRRCTEITNAKRASMFLCDWQQRKLLSMQGDISTTLSIDHGVVGKCVLNGEIINVSDVSNDSNFNKSIDERMGFETKSILCVPMYIFSNKDENNDINDDSHSQSSIHPRKKVIGVIELINKTDQVTSGGFTEEDEHFVETIMCAAGPVCHKFKVFASKAHMEVNEKFVKESPTINTRPSVSKPIPDLDSLVEQETEDDDQDQDA